MAPPMIAQTTRRIRSVQTGPVTGSHGRTGFTFLELIVVLALLAIISAIIVPVYVRSMNGIQMRSARNGLIGTLRFIQELSVKESREFRLYVDVKSNEYWVMRMAEVVGGEKKFEPIKETWGAKTKLPDQFIITNMKARKERGEKALFIACQPNGASGQAVISVRDEHSGTGKYKIVVLGPMGKIEVQK
jgi:prepilin-type N-terminal cleavage/methylation domain-containing protein